LLNDPYRFALIFDVNAALMAVFMRVYLKRGLAGITSPKVEATLSPLAY
jgi:hypothetical protein